MDKGLLLLDIRFRHAAFVDPASNFHHDRHASSIAVGSIVVLLKAMEHFPGKRQKHEHHAHHNDDIEQES